MANRSLDMASAPAWPIIWCRCFGVNFCFLACDAALEALSIDACSAFSASCLRFGDNILSDVADDI